jgi:DNA-binding NarL/FixJ family response regulator
VADSPASPKVCQTRAVVVDDHPFFRDGLVGWLNSQPGFVCCGDAATVEQGLEVIRETNPDLVLLDLQLKDGDGMQLLSELAPREGKPAVIVISRKDEDVYAIRAIKAGARGYVMKEEAPETLLAAIRTVTEGGIFVGSNVIAGLVGGGVSATADAAGQLASLSNRELEVFERLGMGMSTKAVAADLGLSVKTVDTYRDSLKKKLNLSDSLALVRAATLWHQEMKLPGTE